MNIEHPDITSALAAGYPRGVKDRETPICARCRAVFTENEPAYLIEGSSYCQDCFPLEIIENTPRAYLAELLGVEHYWPYE